MPPRSEITAARVRQAVAEVEATFPFAGYISLGVRQALAHVVPRIAKYVAPPARLLDIGCGPMDKTAVLQLLGYECHAVDDLGDAWHRRDENARRIEAFAARAGIHFHRQPAGEPVIPFPEASFEVVTLFDVIEHLHESPREILNTAGRFLRPGGILCVTMPNAVNLRKRLTVLAGRSNYPPIDQFFLSGAPWRGHVREYTLAEACYVCSMAGFEVLDASGFEGNAFDQLSRLPSPAVPAHQPICAGLTEWDLRYRPQAERLEARARGRRGIPSCHGCIRTSCGCVMAE